MKLNEHINASFKDDAPSMIKEAMLYSLNGKSKHIRSMIIYAILQDYELNPEMGHAAAIAMEMIQTYSLIHDDLPAMDNDDWRRNQASNHKQYDEATAILAGDGLLTKAFEVIVTSEYEDSQKLAIIKELSNAAGINGMILGQFYDMNQDLLNTNNDVLRMYSLKTGMLFGAAMTIGAILANQIERVDYYRNLGQALGVAFQIQDDCFDVEKSQAQLGKSISDATNQKQTIVALVGLKQAAYLLEASFVDVYESLNRYQNHPHLETLIKSVQTRGF